MRAATTLRLPGLALLVLGAAACASLRAPDQPRVNPSALRGQTLVERNCGGCHAVGRWDVSAMKSAPPLRDISDRFPVEHLEEGLAEGVVTAHPDMPAFAFEADEIQDIIAYLRSID